MVALGNEYKSTVNLFIVEDSLPYFIHQVFPTNSNYVIRFVMDFDPIYTSASGKVALAYMCPAVRESYLASLRSSPDVYGNRAITYESVMTQLEQIKVQEYSCKDENPAEGISAVAVPIFDGSRNLFGTLSVTAASTPFSIFLKQLIVDLKKESALITQELFTQP